MSDSYIYALLGGLLMGIGTSLLLILNGRISGVSGIFNNLLKLPVNDTAWRANYVLGLLLGAGVLSYFKDGVFGEPMTSLKGMIVAGLLVGFGTAMGSGCTSGHGICGISRLSKRSIVATLAFMGSGFITASLIAWMRGH